MHKNRILQNGSFQCHTKIRDSAGYVFQNEDVQSAFEITREVFAGNFDGIRERYRDKRISSEALFLIGQMAGSTELIEMGKLMEVTNIKKKSLLLQTVREENCTSAFRMTEQRNHII